MEGGSQVHILSREDGVVEFPGFYYADTIPTTQIAAEPITDSTLRTIVRRRWDEEHMPHEITLGPPHEADPGESRGFTDRRRRLHVTIGEVTAGRLRNYLDGRGLVSHALHGSVGKALETLKVAADLIPQQEAGVPDWESDFVSYKALKNKADKELTRYGVDHLRKSIATAIAKQIKTGRPYELGEVVVGGALRHPGPYRNIRYPQIARTSLANLAEAFDDGHPTRRFLQQFRSAEDQ